MAEDDSTKPSEPDDGLKRPKRPRQPVTIDLEAKVVEPKPSEPSAATEPPRDPTPPGPASVDSGSGTERAKLPPGDRPPVIEPKQDDRSPAFRLVIAAIVGALILLAGAFAIQMSGLMAGFEDRSGAIALAEIKGLGDRLAALDQRVGALESARTSPAGDAVQGLTAKIDGLAKDAGQLHSRLDRLEAAAPAANATSSGKPGTDMSSVLDELVARVDRLEGAAGSDPGHAAADLADLGTRVATVETVVQTLMGRIDTLAAKPNLAAENERVTRALALGSLRQASARSGPFAGEFGMVKALGLDEAAIATLAPLAGKGAPSQAELAAQFPAVADKIVAAATTVDPDAGWFDRFLGHLGGLVSVRPVHPVPGKTAEAIVSRMSADVVAGDLAKALAEREALAEPGKIVSAVWAEAAADRVAIDKLVDQLALAAPPPASGN